MEKSNYGIATQKLLTENEEGKIMARILVCDDAAFMRMTLIKILHGAGHEVVGEAGNGLEAIKKYQELHPDIVLMDITMPELDGIGATQAIRAIDPNAGIIIVSAMGHQDKVFSAIQAGAKDFIVKPFEPDRIVACIKKHFGE